MEVEITRGTVPGVAAAVAEPFVPDHAVTLALKASVERTPLRADSAEHSLLPETWLPRGTHRVALLLGKIDALTLRRTTRCYGGLPV